MMKKENVDATRKPLYRRRLVLLYQEGLEGKVALMSFEAEVVVLLGLSLSQVCCQS